MSGEHKAAPANDSRWRVGVEGILAMVPNYYPGAGTHVSYCAPLGEAACLDAGAGFRTMFRGSDGRPLFSGNSEISMTPKLHLGIAGILKRGVGLGVRGEMGYSFIQGHDSDQGLFLAANAFLLGNILESLGLQATIGIVRDPPPGGTEFKDGLGPEASVGLYLKF